MKIPLYISIPLTILWLSVNIGCLYGLIRLGLYGNSSNYYIDGDCTIVGSRYNYTIDFQGLYKGKTVNYNNTKTTHFDFCITGIYCPSNGTRVVSCLYNPLCGALLNYTCDENWWVMVVIMIGSLLLALSVANNIIVIFLIISDIVNIINKPKENNDTTLMA